jgi:hypothetical protein
MLDHVVKEMEQLGNIKGIALAMGGKQNIIS